MAVLSILDEAIKPCHDSRMSPPRSSSSSRRPAARPSTRRRRPPRIPQPSLPLTSSGVPVIERVDDVVDRRRNPRGLGVAATIRVRRHGREYTHTFSAIARGTAASVSSVSLIFNGKRPGMASTLYRIATYLHVSVDDLYAYLATVRAPRKT